MTPADSAARTGRPCPAHRDPHVLRWLCAYGLSVMGDSVYFMALGWAAAQVAGPAQVGLVMAVGAVPRAILMLVGGVVADRFDPRRVVIGSDAARALMILGVAAALWLARPGLWLLVVVALAFGVVDALFMPAVGALAPRLTSPDQFVRVQGLRMLLTRVGTTAGPPLAGFAMAYGQSAAAFAVAGGLFVLSLVLLFFVRIGPLPPDDKAAQPTTPWRDLTDGLGYIRRHPIVGPLVLSGALSQFGIVPPLQVGGVLLAAERGWDAAGIGWILAAFGVGAGISGLALTVRGRFRRAGVAQNVLLVVASAAIGAIGVLPTVPGATAVALGAGLLSGLCGGLAGALIQTHTTAAFQGRVAAVNALTHVGIAPLAFPLFGAAAGAFGVGPMFLIGGAISASGAIVGSLSPALRRASLPGPGTPPAPAPAPSRSTA
ncbi:MFS transporter [Streptomyces luteolus]|uniref:MFS transporter n=1 Tax=Streptomyces luteolus TaxID=3043615 RepID=A0ABT6T3G2_9ACTN|nr:MFS transporter [Streptomyces sp. B-S-A12]MDI3422400.1 MFS transporter [Streptomyces sp. B-S-A12]